MINKDLNERIGITLRKETVAELDKLCADEFRTRSNFIEYLIIKYLKSKQ